MDLLVQNFSRFFFGHTILYYIQEDLDHIAQFCVFAGTNGAGGVIRGDSPVGESGLDIDKMWPWRGDWQKDIGS